MTHRPIEIVGGGLAGLSLGLALRQAGVATSIFEAGDYPRHRVCGEFIAGLAPATLARLGLEPILADALLHREVAWFRREQPVRLQRLPAPALGISRHLLDFRLAESFRAAGGKLHVRSRMPDGPASEGRIHATGRRRSGSDWLGLKLHALDLAVFNDLELHLGEQAYVGLSRVEDGRVNVCGLFRRRPLCAKGSDLLLAYLMAAGLGGLAGRLSRARLDPASCSAVAALGFDRGVTASDRLQLGDVSAMIPPFTGNGMAMAFQSAEIALDPLIAYARGEAAWPATQHEVTVRLRRRFRVRLASAAMIHPWLLHAAGQRGLHWLGRARLLPLRPLYAALH